MFIIMYYIALIAFTIYVFKTFQTSLRTGLIICIVFTSFSLPSLPWSAIPIDATIIQVFFIGLAFFYRFILIKTIDKRILHNSYLWKLLLLWVLFVLYLSISESNSYGTEKVLLFTVKSLLPIFTLGLFLPFKKNELKLIFVTLLCGSILSAFNLFTYGNLSGERAFIMGTSSLVTARTIGIGTVLVLVMILTWNKKKNNLKILFFLLISFFLIYPIFLTGSRGSIIAIVIATLLIILLQKNIFKKSRSLVILSLVGLISLLVLLVVPSSFSESTGIDRIINFTETSDNSDTKRFENYVIAWEGIKNSKGLGIGTGDFSNLSYQANQYYPHNIFLEIALEQGILGLLILVSILYSSLLRTKKILDFFYFNPYIISLASLWIFGLVNALVAGDIGKNILWLTLGILWLLPYKQHESNNYKV